MSEPPTDPNQAAADLVSRASGAEESLPADLEAAWEAWSKQIKNVDARGRELLRAAFEAGYGAHASSVTNGK